MINRGKPDTSYRIHELLATTSEISIGINENSASTLSGKISEGSVEFSIHAGIGSYNALAPRACGCNDFYSLGGHVWVVPITQQADDLGMRNHLTQNLEPLRKQAACQYGNARDVSTRPIQAGDEPISH